MSIKIFFVFLFHFRTCSCFFFFFLTIVDKIDYNDQMFATCFFSLSFFFLFSEVVSVFFCFCTFVPLIIQQKVFLKVPIEATVIMMKKNKSKFTAELFHLFIFACIFAVSLAIVAHKSENSKKCQCAKRN